MNEDTAHYDVDHRYICFEVTGSWAALLETAVGRVPEHLVAFYTLTQSEFEYAGCVSTLRNKVRTVGKENRDPEWRRLKARIREEVRIQDHKRGQMTNL